MRDKTSIKKPIQAGDYGQPVSRQTPEEKAAAQAAAAKRPTTDGRKTLALWSH